MRHSLLAVGLILVAVRLASAQVPRPDELVPKESPHQPGEPRPKAEAIPRASLDGGRTALHQAARAGDLKRMRNLIQQGAAVNAQDRSGQTPLVDAASSGEPEAVKLLLKAGAKLDPSVLGRPAVPRVEVARVLLEAGADPSAGVYYAAQEGRAEVLKLLLDRGGKVEAKLKDGSTALHAAALQGELETVRLLLERGADPNVVDQRGETPLHKAVSGDRDLERVKLLVRSGAKMDLTDARGVTPVRLAFMNGKTTKPIYDWLLAANGGKEPRPRLPKAVLEESAGKTTEELLSALSSRNEEERAKAQAALVQRGDKIIPAVLNRLESENQQVGPLYELLAAMGPDAAAALPQLKARLADKEHVFIALITIDRVQPGAVSNLSEGLKKTAAESLYQVVVDAKSDMMAGYCSAHLIRLGKPAVPFILPLLRHENANLRGNVARLLESAEFSDEEIEAELVKLAQHDGNVLVRSKAASSLTRFGNSHEEAKSALLDIIKHATARDGSASSRAATALARLGPEVIDDLVPLLSPLDAPGRGAAIVALRSMGAPAVPRLMRLLADRDESVAIAASLALERFSPEAVAALAKTVETGDDPVANRAANVLHRLDRAAKEALPALLKVAGSEERSDVLRVSAARAALKVDPKCVESDAILSVVPVLIRVLERGSFKHQAWAAEAAGSIGPPARDALPTLRKRLELPAPDGGVVPSYVREEAAKAIAAIEVSDDTQAMR